MNLRAFVPSLVLLLLMAMPAHAVPDPLHCTVPHCLVACPLGDLTYTVVVRDVANVPIALCPVELRFDACPSFSVCADCCTGLTVDRTLHRVTATTDVNGNAGFPLKMGGVCAGAMVGVYAAGVLLASVHLASPDQDGNLSVGAADVSIVNGLIGSSNPGADFDCDGGVTQFDLDWLTTSHNHHTCNGIVDARSPSWGRLKVIYR